MTRLLVPTPSAPALRDPHAFKWYAIVLLALVVYVYAVEVERGRWDVVACGLAVWLADWFNEIVNGVIGHAASAPLWRETGPSAYQILVGLNVESSFLFAIAGVVYAKLLPARRSARIIGIPNRLAIGLGLSMISVAVELYLHATGDFHWHYWWWNEPFVLLIVLFGYLWFFLYGAWVFDAPSSRSRFARLGALAGVDLVLGLVFGPVLGWL